MSVLLDTTDALAATLNEHNFSRPFTATRSYKDWEAERVTALTVDVLPVGLMHTEMETRGSLLYQPAVDVVIRQTVPIINGRVDADEVDALVSLVEEINEYIMGRDNWQSVVMNAVNHQHLREWQQFTGLIRVTYQVSKCLAS